MMIDVSGADWRDIDELSAVLSRAFQDDPVWTWMQPDPTGRTRLFAAMARYHHFAGGGIQAARRGGAIGAAALWDPPERWQHRPIEQLRAAPSLLRALGARLPRALRLDSVAHAAHPEEPHWYLAVIGSDPTVRGGGFGQTLMKAGLARCDAEHAPAYLESSKPENVPYYERFGFEVTGEIVVPGGPTLIPMWRRAQ